MVVARVVSPPTYLSPLQPPCVCVPSSHSFQSPCQCLSRMANRSRWRLSEKKDNELACPPNGLRPHPSGSLMLSSRCLLLGMRQAVGLSKDGSRTSAQRCQLVRFVSSRCSCHPFWFVGSCAALPYGIAQPCKAWWQLVIPLLSVAFAFPLVLCILFVWLCQTFCGYLSPFWAWEVSKVELGRGTRMFPFSRSWPFYLLQPCCANDWLVAGPLPR